MEKKTLYSTPVARYCDVLFEHCFVQTNIGSGTIDPGQEDDWGTLEP